MWSFGVVVFPPLFDQDLCFAKRVEDLTIQQLIPEPCVEAFAISVLPGRPRFDVSGIGPDGCNPVSDGLSNELGAQNPLQPYRLFHRSVVRFVAVILKAQSEMRRPLRICGQTKPVT
jgi:hypothetical protein